MTADKFFLFNLNGSDFTSNKRRKTLCPFQILVLLMNLFLMFNTFHEEPFIKKRFVSGVNSVRSSMLMKKTRFCAIEEQRNQFIHFIASRENIFPFFLHFSVLHISRRIFANVVNK